MFHVNPSVRFQRQSCCRFWRTSSKASDAPYEVNEPMQRKESCVGICPTHNVTPVPCNIDHQENQIPVHLHTFAYGWGRDPQRNPTGYWKLKLLQHDHSGLIKPLARDTCWLWKGILTNTYQDSYQKMTQIVGTFYHAWIWTVCVRLILNQIHLLNQESAFFLILQMGPTLSLFSIKRNPS